MDAHTEEFQNIITVTPPPQQTSPYQKTQPLGLKRKYKQQNHAMVM